MKRPYQKGTGTLISVLIIFTVGLLLLTALQRELEGAFNISGQERFYLKAYNQAASSLSWGVSKQWPLRSLSQRTSRRHQGWYCETEQINQLKSCIKPMLEIGIFLIKGESILGNRSEKIILYQSAQTNEMPNTTEQKLVPVTGGWLDFCPVKNEKFCLD